MSACMPMGCSEIGTSPDCTCTAANVGVGLEHYVTGSTGPFEFRRTTPTGDIFGVQIDPVTNVINHTVNLATRTGLQSLIASPSKTLVTGDVLLFLMALEAGTGITFDNITADSFRINAPGAGATAANIGSGIDVYEAASSGPFNFRRLSAIDDGSDIHGLGNVAHWQDGQNAKMDLPRGHVQNSTSIAVNNVLTTLIDHTYNDDSAGANVAGKDGEDWTCWWSLKICCDPGQPLIDSVFQLESHNGAWNILDVCHCRWLVGTLPSAPACRPYLLTNTDWSTNGGLRLRIRVASNHFAVFNQFEHPSIHIMRFNKAAP